jgi:hypothetical protein
VLSAISRGGVEVSAAVEPPICVFAARGPGGCASQDRTPRPPSPAGTKRGPRGRAGTCLAVVLRRLGCSKRYCVIVCPQPTAR